MPILLRYTLYAIITVASGVGSFIVESDSLALVLQFKAIWLTICAYPLYYWDTHTKG